MRRRYVVGFLFDGLCQNVTLIKKTHPEWQKGKLNGVGGKIEPNETSTDAMRREFREEAGVDIDSWEAYAGIQGPDYDVFFFRAFVPIYLFRQVTSNTEEFVIQMPVRHLCERVDLVYHLQMMIHMALNRQLSIPIIMHERPHAGQS
jgi:8-oxo-dGTP diphosphatase